MPRFPIGIAVVLIALGCGQQPATPPAPIATPPPPSEDAAPAADHTATLAELTQALRKYSAEKQRVPDNLSELVTGGYLKQLPAAPPGQTFAIDKKQVQVVLQ
jgi:hypothetical protein